MRHAVLLAMVAVAGPAGAVPRLMTYQGRIEGLDVVGSVDVDFALYDALAGGTALWSETQTVDLWDGVFTAHVGAETAGGIPLDFDENLWLALTVYAGGEPTVFPRQQASAMRFARSTPTCRGARRTTAGRIAAVAALDDGAGDDARKDDLAGTPPLQAPLAGSCAIGAPPASTPRARSHETTAQPAYDAGAGPS